VKIKVYEMIKKYSIIAVAMCALLGYQVAESRSIVVDASDRMPLAGASVFDRTGTLVTLTDGFGAFDNVALPATVRCLGYETCSVETSGADTVALTPVSYELGGMTVNLAEREVLRLVCYVRGYIGSTTSADTISSFCEFMVDYMLPVRKLKKYKGRMTPRMLAGRGVSRRFSSDGTDSISAGLDDMQKAWLQLATVQIPDKDILPDSLRGTTGVQTKPGKYGPVMERRVTPESVVVSIDALADKKEHRWSPWFFKLLGCTIDFTDLRESTAYSIDESGIIRPEFLQMRTFSMSALGRGKFIRMALESKTPVEMHMYFEIYPVDREYLTMIEAKATDKEEAPAMDIVVPESALPLDEATVRLLELARMKE